MGEDGGDARRRHSVDADAYSIADAKGDHDPDIRHVGCAAKFHCRM